MARAYSLDLRERVVAAVGAGHSCRSVAKTFLVSVASVVKWSQRHRRTGSARPAQIGGYRKAILLAHRDFVADRFAAVPELTLRRLQSELAKRGVKVSYGAIWTFVHAQGLSFKKNRTRKRAGPAGRRKTKSAVEKASSEH